MPTPREITSTVFPHNHFRLSVANAPELEVELFSLPWQCPRPDSGNIICSRSPHHATAQHVDLPSSYFSPVGLRARSLNAAAAAAACRTHLCSSMGRWAGCRGQGPPRTGVAPCQQGQAGAGQDMGRDRGSILTSCQGVQSRSRRSLEAMHSTGRGRRLPNRHQSSAKRTHKGRAGDGIMIAFASGMNARCKCKGRGDGRGRKAQHIANGGRLQPQRKPSSGLTSEADWHARCRQ